MNHPYFLRNFVTSFRIGNSTGDQAGPITQFWWPWGQVPFWGGSFSRKEWTHVEMFWEIVHLKQKTKWEAYRHHPIGIVELKIVEVNIRKSSTWLGLEMGWTVWEGGVWLLWSAMAYWHWGILRLFNFWQKRDGNLKFSTSCLSPTPWLFSESFIDFHISQTGHEILKQPRIVWKIGCHLTVWDVRISSLHLPEILTLTAANLQIGAKYGKIFSVTPSEGFVRWGALWAEGNGFGWVGWGSRRLNVG